MPADASASDVFLSYASEDFTRVKPLVSGLRDAGVSVFWDRVIPPTMTWRDVLERELRRAKCLVVVGCGHPVSRLEKSAAILCVRAVVWERIVLVRRLGQSPARARLVGDRRIQGWPRRAAENRQLPRSNPTLPGGQAGPTPEPRRPDDRRRWCLRDGAGSVRLLRHVCAPTQERVRVVAGLVAMP